MKVNLPAASGPTIVRSGFHLVRHRQLEMRQSKVAGLWSHERCPSVLMNPLRLGLVQFDLDRGVFGAERSIFRLDHALLNPLLDNDTCERDDRHDREQRPQIELGPAAFRGGGHCLSVRSLRPFLDRVERATR